MITDNKSTQDSILQGLNPRQLEAVQTESQETLVIAGAGSGKTSVLTRRVAYLITQGELPGSILCLTFTNKAAKEMNHRVHLLLRDSGINMPQLRAWEIDYHNTPLLCTFHSLGVRILREFGGLIDLAKEFSILDSGDQKSIIKNILKERNLDPKQVNPNLVLYFISKCKQELLTASQSRQLKEEYLPVFHDLYAAYEKTLKSSQVVDFDDLIFLPNQILENNPEVLDTLQNRWKHILVDEFQDTNKAQFAIVKLLYGKL